MSFVEEFSFKRVGFVAIESDQDWLLFMKGLRIAVGEKRITYKSSRMKTSQVDDGITNELIEIAKNALEAMKDKIMGKYDGIIGKPCRA